MSASNLKIMRVLILRCFKGDCLDRLVMEIKLVLFFAPMFNGWLFRVLVEDALSDGYLYLCELNSNVIYSNSKYILVLRIYIWKIDSLKE